MRQFFAVFVILAVLTVPAVAQYGHEWIDFSQSYYKIPVAADGLYRLTYTELQQAGFPVSSIDPRRIQIFHRGVEQAIHVEGQADAVFNPSDYIEFYGQRNDGTQDAELYEPAAAQPHPYYNLYSDTTAYFLTVNPLAVQGKRMSLYSEVNTGGLPAETSYPHSVLRLITNQYTSGLVVNNYLFNTYSDIGEGWTGVEIRQNQQVDYSISGLVSGLSGEGTPQLEVQLVGRHELSHRAQIYVGPTTGGLRLLTTVDFINFNTYTVSLALNWSDIGADGTMVVRIRGLGVGGAAERLSANYIRVTYPRDFNMSGVTQRIVDLNANPGNKSFIQLTNPAAGLRIFDVTDPSAVRRIGTTLTTTLNAMIDNASSSRKLLVVNQVLSTGPVKKVAFRQIIPEDHNYIIISHKRLMQPGGEYNNPVKAYGGYRSSPEGGGYDTLVVDVDMLYNQYAYGEVTPLAIKRFMKFLVDNHPPEYLFLIGKGLQVNSNYHRNPSAFTTYADLVPSIGFPCSDIYYTAGLNGTTYEPAVPTGRISVMEPGQVAAYLNKVKETESLAYNVPWRKNLLHLSGGINAGEPERFKEYLKGFGNIAEGFYLGGQVNSIAKETTDIDFINVKDEVNAGLNLVTFFGHSSPNTIDFDIGFVTDPQLGYNNKGKYPVMLMNGCNIGSFFLNGIVFGEDWINAADRGAIGFIAHSSFGLEITLRYYSELFYTVGYGDEAFIGKGLGDIQKEVARRYMAVLSPTVPNITQVQQMVLLGDPAVKLFGATKTDYEVKPEGLFMESFDDEPITALSDSMALRMIVRNYGIADEDPMLVRVVRTLPDGTSFSYDSLYAPVLNTDTLTMSIPMETAGGFGMNIFTVIIDPEGQVDELDEDNNEATLEFFVPLSRTRQLFPARDAIVYDPNVTLVFQSTDLLSPQRTFVIQVDTVDSFNSPYLKELSQAATVLGSLDLPILAKDSLAYYWRTRYAEPLPGESADWTLSSFTFIDDSRHGWAQVHHQQWKGNNLAGLEHNEAQKKLNFVETVTTVSVKTYGADNPALNTDVSIKLNDVEYNLSTQNQPCRDNTINLIAFSKTTTVPYTPISFLFNDPRGCGRVPNVIVSFRTNEIGSGTDDLSDYVDGLEDGDSVVIFSIGNAGYSTWSSPVISKLGELGISSTDISSLTDGEPVVIFARKGAAPGTATVYRTAGVPPGEQELIVNGTITGRYTSGEMATRVGPATEWESFSFKAILSELPQTDEVAFDIYGVTLDGQRDLHFSNITATTDLSTVDPDVYPYLDVVYKPADEVNLTPPQLDHWIVHYAPAAEGVVFFAGNPDPQVLQEGEAWTGTYGFVNISSMDFIGPLDVRVEVFNRTSKTRFTETIQIAPPVPGDTTLFEIMVDTRGKTGVNDVSVFVNPRVLTEQYYDNNLIELKEHLSVKMDQQSPVLEVSIDGRLIRNGDFVSPNPVIRIRLIDDNSLMPKTDPDGIRILFRSPCDAQSCPLEEILFDRDDVTWSAATPETPFTIEFRPAALAEGIYTLSVEATDASGNPSGSTPYMVTFEVRYALSLVFIAPHPNPSSGGVIFAFHVSGDAPPDFLGLDILNLQGKVVNRIALTSGLRIGWNEFLWPGTDATGNPVPSGLYLYRLEVHLNGKALPIQTPEGVNVLRGGYGRLLIQR